MRPVLCKFVQKINTPCHFYVLLYKKYIHKKNNYWKNSHVNGARVSATGTVSQARLARIGLIVPAALSQGVVCALSATAVSSLFQSKMPVCTE